LCMPYVITRTTLDPDFIDNILIPVLRVSVNFPPKVYRSHKMRVKVTSWSP